jgi:hypothetical protein
MAAQFGPGLTGLDTFACTVLLAVYQDDSALAFGVGGCNLFGGFCGSGIPTEQNPHMKASRRSCIRAPILVIV